MVEESEGYAALRAADGRGLAFDAPALGARAYNRLEKMSLLRDERGYGVLDHGQGLTYRFGLADAEGVRALAAVENANGFAIRFSYDERGHLTHITDSAQRVFTVACDEMGRILTISTAHPTEPKQRVTLVTYGYNKAGELVSATDALGQVARYQYQDRLLVQETFKNGLNFYFEYAGSGPAARCVHTWGDEGIYDHRLAYDMEAKRTVVTNSLGYATTYFGNENGLVVEVQDARGGVTLTEYNEFNEVLSETDALGHSTTYAYDERGNRTQVQLPDGTQTQWQYDGHDRLTSSTDALGEAWQWQYDEAGNVRVRIDPAGRTTTYTYKQGRAVRLTDEATQQATTLAYDAQGNLQEVHTPDGRTSRLLCDTWGRRLKLTTARGNVQWRAYNLHNWVTSVHEPDGNVRRFAYNALGQVTRATDRRRDVHYTYRGLGCLVRRTEAGMSVEFLHDTEEQLRAVVNEYGLHYRFGLDALGEVATETGFDGLTRHYQRDAGGRLVELRLPTGQRTRYAYDALGRTTQVQYGDGSFQHYHYDAAGTLVEATNETSTVAWAWESGENQLHEVQGPHTVTSRYDAQGQRVGLTSSLGAQVDYERDAFGRVRQLQAPGWQAVFERDAQGLEVQRQLSGGVLTSWQRDALGQPHQQRMSAGWGAARTERHRTYGWAEDAQLHRLDDSVTGLTEFTHDALGQLAATRYASGEQQLRWPDAVGNLFGTQERDDRHYGPAGQLLQAGGMRYRYDGLGRLVGKTTAQGAEWAYTWNGAGHLVEVMRPDGHVVRFAYDALGRRISKSFKGQFTRWVWDGEVPLHEWQELEVGPGAGSVDELTTWLFEDASFVPAARLTAQGAQSVVCDHLGTPLALYDGQGRQTWDLELDSYGAVRRGRGRAQDCPFRYQGQYEDVETGLYYNRFRYYDPEAGQYISQDPIRLLGGGKMYAYVVDPLQWVDALGLMPFWKDLKPEGWGHHPIPRVQAKGHGLDGLGTPKNTPSWYPNDPTGTATLHQSMHEALAKEGIPFKTAYNGSQADMLAKVKQAYQGMDTKGFIKIPDDKPNSSGALFRDITIGEAVDKQLEWEKDRVKKAAAAAGGGCPGV